MVVYDFSLRKGIRNNYKFKRGAIILTAEIRNGVLYLNNYHLIKRLTDKAGNITYEVFNENKNSTQRGVYGWAVYNVYTKRLILNKKVYTHVA